MRCFAHILQLIVRDGIAICQASIKKIRDVVRYIRSSTQRSDLLKRCDVLANVKSKKTLQLDCPTRWNSTYLMLEAALGHQKAFDRLEDLDSKFIIDFGEDMPNDSNWASAAILTRFLKKFYDVTCKLSGSIYCTSNLYFPEIMRILKELQNCENSKDVSLVNMGKQMREKFNKYWGTLEKMNVMLFVACVLDPRYKMKYLEAKYTAHYSENDASELVARVTKAMNELMDEYKIMDDQMSMNGGMDSSYQPQTDVDEVNNLMEEEEIDEYFLKKENGTNMPFEGELDRYLEEYAEKFTVDFNVLLWWKVNAARYPVLSMVARDVLAIQASTVASESAFSTGGRTLDKFRSSLTPTTAEVLICCQDWLRSSKKPIQVEENIEELEHFESEITQEPEILDSVVPRTKLDC